MIASGLTTSHKIPNIDRGFAIHAQAFDGAAHRRLLVMGVDVLEDGIGFGNFFEVWT
jgi:hypothetical protein